MGSVKGPSLERGATGEKRRNRTLTTGSHRGFAATIIAGLRLRHLPYCRLDIDDLNRFDVVGFA